LGDVYLIANLAKLNSQLINTFQVILIIFVSSVVISYILSLRLQKNISNPILKLANTTKHIRESQTYKERIESSGIAEIDQVKEEFNSLLDQIGSRENDLKHLASHDVLTKLPNRAYFSDILIQALIRGIRKSYKHAILFVDLDRFKTINDSLGHTAGDDLLAQFSNRLLTVMRGEDLVARLGGDEFTILLQDISGHEQAVEVATRVVQTLSQPFLISGHEVVISPSIGIVVYPEHGATPEELLKNADTAMYAAKHLGGNKYAFFDKNMDIAAKDRLHIEQALRKGIEKDEFYLLFQPQINLKNEKINGFESLCRWSKNSKTLVCPDHFIPVAEETGLITVIGEQLLDKAFGQVKKWVTSGLLDGRVAINISAKQFTQSDPDLYSVITQLLAKHTLSPNYIELEITEAALMDQSGHMIDIMKKFKRLGFEFAIDDFGTGYSSLTYLSKFPIDTLKIDMSFIRNLEFSDSQRSIVKTIINLGDNLGLKVIAEGVETRAQYDILARLGCDSIQGYILSRPLDARDVDTFIVNNNYTNVAPLFQSDTKVT
jgi:diguanylate cyclase (GGDEF)-like protein